MRKQNWWILIAAALIFLIGAPAQAQQGTPINPGDVLTGNLPAGTPNVTYLFNAQEGQSVTVEVLGATSGFAPVLTVLNQNNALVQAFGNPTLGNRLSALIAFPQAGLYQLQVGNASGTPGDFVITLTTQPVVPPTPLVLDQPQGGVLQPGEQKFYTSPATDQPQVLQIDWEKQGVVAGGVFVEVRIEQLNASIASISPVLYGAVLILPPNPNPAQPMTFQIIVSNPPDAVPAQYQLSLTLLPDVAGVPSLNQTAEPGATTTLPTLPTTGPCVIATRENIAVNVRTGPGTAYPAVAGMSPANIYTVVGRNEDSSWWKINYGSGEGWVSAGVTRTGGNCSTIGLASYPPPPTVATTGTPATPTPTGTQYTPTYTPTGTQYTPTYTPTGPTATPSWTYTPSETYTPTWTPTP